MEPPSGHLVEFFRRFDSTGGALLLALAIFLLTVRVRAFMRNESGPKTDFLSGIIGLTFCVSGFLIMAEIRRRLWESGQAFWFLAESWYFLPIKLCGFIGGVFVIKALTDDSSFRTAWIFVLGVTLALLSLEQLALFLGDLFYTLFKISEQDVP